MCVKTVRSSEVDVIRLAALVGIAVVNVPFMGLPTEAAFTSPTDTVDLAVSFFVECFLQLKFFLLFSFVFGWGFHIQKTQAEARGHSLRRRYFRRLIGLAGFGFAHALFIFSGDILVLYALLGVLLWFVKNRSVNALKWLAALTVPVSICCLMLLGAIIDQVSVSDLLDHSSASAHGLGGSFWDATRTRWVDWPSSFGFLVLLQGPLAFGAFLLGLVAARTEFFKSGNGAFARLLKRASLLLVVALPLNIAYAAAMAGLIPDHYEWLLIIGFLGIALGAPLLSALYLIALVQFARTFKLSTILLLAGQNSLSAYLLQGIIAGFVFGSYGLGWFGELGHAALLVLSLMIAWLSLIVVGGLCPAFWSRAL